MKNTKWFMIVGWLCLMLGCLSPPGTAGPTLSVEQLGGTQKVKTGNPFIGSRFFIDPSYVEKVKLAAESDAANSQLLSKVASFPTGIWLDSIANLERIAPALERAREQQARDSQPVVPLFVVYNLPNRDCSALSSNGELRLEADGEARYRKEFIDYIAEQFKAYNQLKIVAIIEPDSLPNLVTNMHVPKCAASAKAYRDSVAYAISKLSMPHVYLYLDAAHSGWLGWNNNRVVAAQVFREVLNQAGGVNKIRGFATNVSNYNAIEGRDGKRLDSSNPCPNETVYVKRLSENLEDVGITGAGFIIDTGRNGRIGIRKKWGSWCNVRGAGLGERPRIAPSDLIDAYFWIKPPGDSDGTSDPAAPRFDASCRSQDSLQGAPQAGKWFQSYFVELVRNANPQL